MTFEAKRLLKAHLASSLARTEEFIARACVQAGAMPNVAYAAAGAATLLVWLQHEEALRALGVLDDGEELQIAAAVTDWPALARQAGQPFDIEGWSRYAAQGFEQGETNR